MLSDTSSEAPAPRGADIRTFLFADLRGYTRYTQERGDEAASALAARFADIVRDTMPEFDGQLLELRGDEALCVFASARQALRAAVALQRWFRKRVDGEPVLPLGVGMGLDAGEAVPTQGGYRGGALNIAARLCAIAKPGQILASDQAAHLAGRVNGIRSERRRAVRLKGVAEPVRLVEVVPEAALPPLLVHTARRRGRRWLAGLGVCAAVMVGGIAGFAVHSRSSSLALEADAIAAVDAGGHVHERVSLPFVPSEIASGGGAVWAVDTAGDRVWRVRPQSGTAVPVQVGPAPLAVAFGGRFAWVADSGDGTLARIDPSVPRVVGPPVFVGNGPSAVAWAAHRVWVANSADGSVVEVNPGDDRILRTVSAGSDPVSLAATAGKMWVANEAADTVTPIVLASGRPGAPIHVGHGPDALAVSGGSVWVACGIDGTVWRIDAGSASAKGSFSVGAEPRGIAVVANRLVVAGARGVTVFDRRGLPVSRVHVQGTPAAALSSRGVAWVAAGPMLAAHRGGVLKIETTALSYPPGSVPGCRPSLDAQSICAYTTAPWQVSSLLHDGLLTFKHVPGPDGQTIVADLAQALPTVSRDRRTFVFQLRHGVRYSDGRPVRPSDIQRGIERTYRINPAGQPFFTYYSAIAGAAKCAARPRTCDLSHGIVADDAAGTVTFHLTRPDPNFLAALALPFAIAVPVGTPMSDLDFRINLLPATGPYAVSRADPTHGLLLVRNPHFRVWSADAQPAGFPNHVVWKVAPSPNREVADVLAGRADWMDDTMPADAGRRLLLNHPELLHPRTLAALHAIFLNPGMAPFDAVRARQAVEYAVGRATLLRKLGPLFGAPTCQMLPPGIPGYRPNRPCPFTIGSWGPNIAKARSLVSESGTTGDRVNIWTRGDPVISPVTRYIRGVLRSIGYQATLIPANHANTVPIEVFPAGVGADFPAASFFLGTTGCAPSPQGCPWTRAGWLDQLKTHALAAQLFNTYFASERWAELDRRLTDSGSTWVPLFNDIAPGLTSRRVGNYELTASPVGAPLIDQMWVK